MNKNLLRLKEVLGKNNIRLGVYIALVLWLSFGVQFLTNKIIQPKNNILEAFINTKSEISYITLEMAGLYGDGILVEEDKKELIYTIAKEIGLQLDDNLISKKDEERSELYYSKDGKNAETMIKVYSRPSSNSSNPNEMENYVLVRLKVLTNPQSSLEFRKVLEDLFESLNIEQTFITMEVSSTFMGKLTLEEMNQIADSMIDNLRGKIIEEHRVEGLFTIYGFTGLLPEYIMDSKNKINIHVAITYNEEEDKTKVILATPIINGVY